MGISLQVRPRKARCKIMSWESDIVQTQLDMLGQNKFCSDIEM